jgi:hypothetical protein
MIGIEYYSGKRKPFRAYYTTANGTKKYVGYFATEAEAWAALP